VTPASLSIRSFVLRCALWLAPCFAAWYFAAPLHSPIAGVAARPVIALFAPGIVSAIERQGVDLVFVTTLEVHPAPGVTAVLLAEVNPLLYTYGLALFAALMLASGWRWRAMAAGAALLLVFQGWGIAFDLLAQLGLHQGPEVALQAGLANWRREVIALGYQLGTILFPSLAPVILWAAFNRGFHGQALGPHAATAQA